MRARIYDPVGPWWWHSPLPLLGALLVAGGLWWARGEGGAWGLLTSAVGLGLLMLSRIFPRRFAERDARLELGVGRVDVLEAGPLSQRIVARRVRAASTAQGQDGSYAVALDCAGRLRHPLVLKVESAGEVDRVCDALGVGYYGVGELRWPSEVGEWRNRRIVAWGGVAGCACLAAYFACPGQEEVARVALGALMPHVIMWVAVAACFLAWGTLKTLRNGGPSRWVSLTKMGLDLSRSSAAFRFVPYHLIEQVVEAPGAVEVTMAHPYGSMRVPLAGLSEPGGGADVEAFAAQLRTAARRARGERGPEPAISPSVESLRRHGESLKQWLERLDATAQAMRSGSAYRGAAVSVRELREALDNHDADPELRAAAARVLVRVAPDEARPRVDAAVATMRDDRGRRRLRLVADEVDDAEGEALRELEGLDAAARRRRA